MKISSEDVDNVNKAWAQLDFDVSKMRDNIRHKAPKDVPQLKGQNVKRRMSLAAEIGSQAQAALQYERIINGDDLINVNYLEKGNLAARPIGRVHVKDSGGNVVGYGTGFLIAPGVLLTNNHVLKNREMAAVSMVEFDYELDLNGKDKPTHLFALRPDQLFATSEELDYSCVAVALNAGESGRPLSNYGFLKLIAEQGKLLAAEYVSIIQHPGGERKQVAIRENKVLKIEEKVVWYATDTLQGSSGSPVFNNSWQVVALHHLGVPRTDSEGNWLTKNGQPWNDSMDESLVDWIANEGIRISRIVADLQARKRGHALLKPIFEGASPVLPPRTQGALAADGEVAGLAQSASAEANGKGGVMSATLSGTACGDFIVNVPLRISVALAQNPSGANGGLVQPPSQEEKISIDPDYSKRMGYDPDFLGAAQSVPLPTLSSELEADVAILNDGSGSELKYHHFSVVMNARRRVAFFTAVNIDGRQSKKPKRERDCWIYDPRLPKDAQVGNDLYACNLLDRGHLVRRLDPAWAQSEQLAKVANDDTFHFTNCSPQHKEFNEGKPLWAGLEDYVLGNADAKDLKVTVFSGPVFRADDRVYREVGIPSQFWKVLAAVDEAGNIYAAAYLVSQSRYIKDAPLEFAYGGYSTFQVRIRDIEKLTGLKFDSLSDLDVFKGVSEVELRVSPKEGISSAALGWKPVSDYEGLTLPRRTTKPAPRPNAIERVSVPLPSASYGRFSGTPKTEWLVSPAGPDRDMRLLEEFWYDDPTGRRWVAPAKSEINGASIPRILWSSVGSPYTDDYRCASVVHDVACGNPAIPRKEADKMFYFACLAGGCSAAQARVLYAGVRIGAWASPVGGWFPHRPEMLPAQPREAEIKIKFEEVVSQINRQRHELSFEELDQIVQNSLLGSKLIPDARQIESPNPANCGVSQEMKN